MRLIAIFSFFIFYFLNQEGRSQGFYCHLKGPVFVENNPSRAQFRVFLEESESFADLLVFQAANALFADKPGLWYFTPARAQAAFSILFVKDRSLADFSIHYIETESFAGCPSQK